QRAIHHLTEIESYTDRRWDVPPPDEFEKQIEGTASPFIHGLPAYDYLIYLRHQGFPSPLLDWTGSPYIAAYFAYVEPTDKNRAVFCFIDNIGGGKGGMAGNAFITLH